MSKYNIVTFFFGAIISSIIEIFLYNAQPPYGMATPEWILYSLILYIAVAALTPIATGVALWGFKVKKGRKFLVTAFCLSMGLLCALLLQQAWQSLKSDFSAQEIQPGFGPRKKLWEI